MEAFMLTRMTLRLTEIILL